MIGTIATAKSQEPPISDRYRGRFAPSPSGPLHLGSIMAAVASYLDARSNNGTWLLRIEDIDPERQPDNAVEQILSALQAIGLRADEAISYQSDQEPAHLQCVNDLLAADKAYYCQCSRKEIREKTPEGSHRYPGTCRNKHLSEGAVRVKVPELCVEVEDAAQGRLKQNIQEEVGDFIIRRRDGLVAYQLAVVLDDAAQGITHVVRGMDLWDNTPRQRWLQTLLGLRSVSYLHVPVLVNQAGDKLSKQTGAQAVCVTEPAKLLALALDLLRQSPPADLHLQDKASVLAWGIKHWNPEHFKGLAAVQQKPVAPQQNPLR